MRVTNVRWWRTNVTRLPSARRSAVAAAVSLVALAAAGCGGGAGKPLRVSVDAGGLTAEIATGAPTKRGEVLTVAHVLDGARSVRVGERRARRVHVTLAGARRPARERDADIAPGDSGAPLTRDGRIIGVVFARGRTSAWAVAL